MDTCALQISGVIDLSAQCQTVPGAQKMEDKFRALARISYRLAARAVLTYTMVQSPS